MTKQEALRYFRENIRPYVGNDRTSIRTAWNDWTDSLQKDGQITQRQYDTWLGPREGKPKSSRDCSCPDKQRDPAAYIRKTADEYTLQGKYGERYGWEDLTSENSREEIRQRLKEYRENEGGNYRIVKRRVKRDPQPKRGSMQRARIDRRGTAKPRSRIVGRFPEGQCVGPQSTPSGGYEYRDTKTSRQKSGRDPQPNINPVCPVGTQVQTLILSQQFFNQREAASWIRRHGFRLNKIDESKNFWRFRQQDPNAFEKDSFRTIRLRPGVEAVIGCPRN